MASLADFAEERRNDPCPEIRQPSVTPVAGLTPHSSSTRSVNTRTPSEVGTPLALASTRSNPFTLTRKDSCPDFKHPSDTVSDVTSFRSFINSPSEVTTPFTPVTNNPRIKIKTEPVLEKRTSLLPFANTPSTSTPMCSKSFEREGLMKSESATQDDLSQVNTSLVSKELLSSFSIPPPSIELPADDYNWLYKRQQSDTKNRVSQNSLAPLNRNKTLDFISETTSDQGFPLHQDLRSTGQLHHDLGQIPSNNSVSVNNDECEEFQKCQGIAVAQSTDQNFIKIRRIKDLTFNKISRVADQHHEPCESFNSDNPSVTISNISTDASNARTETMTKPLDLPSRSDADKRTLLNSDLHSPPKNQFLTPQVKRTPRKLFRFSYPSSSRFINSNGEFNFRRSHVLSSVAPVVISDDEKNKTVDNDQSSIPSDSNKVPTSPVTKSKDTGVVETPNKETSDERISRSLVREAISTGEPRRLPSSKDDTKTEAEPVDQFLCSEGMGDTCGSPVLFSTPPDLFNDSVETSELQQVCTAAENSEPSFNQKGPRTDCKNVVADSDTEKAKVNISGKVQKVGSSKDNKNLKQNGKETRMETDSESGKSIRKRRKRSMTPKRLSLRKTPNRAWTHSTSPFNSKENSDNSQVTYLNVNIHFAFTSYIRHAVLSVIFDESMLCDF